MRQLFVVTVVVLAVGVVRAETPGGKTAEVKGPHICCQNCENAVGVILAKVDGISEVKCDRKSKSVTFTAKDAKAANAAWDALYAGGFAGTLTFDGATDARAVKATNDKNDELKFDKVHACCGQCIKALGALFPDAKVSVTGKGAQRLVTISGKDLDAGATLNALNGAGFNGVRVEAKK
jgi:copper chaperone CopZ